MGGLGGNKIVMSFHEPSELINGEIKVTCDKEPKAGNCGIICVGRRQAQTTAHNYSIWTLSKYTQL